MTLHTGAEYRNGDVTLQAPVAGRIRAAHHAEDVKASVLTWLRRAEAGDNVYYFSIHLDEDLVGQVFLHDIDERAGDALVGYHLFEHSQRGHGIGTASLRLLQGFVAAETALDRLILITTGDNPASRRAAEKAGFVYLGPPREDPDGVALVWSVQPRADPAPP